MTRILVARAAKGRRRMNWAVDDRNDMRHSNLPPGTGLRRTKVTGTLLILLLASGCSYLDRRVQDLADAIYVHAGVGLGLEAHVSVLPVIGQLGIGGHVSRRMGFDGWQHGTWTERQVVLAWPLFLGFFDVQRPEHTDGLCELPSYYGCVPVAFGNRFVVGPEAGCFIGIVGIEAGVDVVQFADFVTGWFGLDLLGDDQPAPDFVPSNVWISFWYRLRPFFQALRRMSDDELVRAIHRTEGAARYVACKELARRPIPNKLDILLDALGTMCPGRFNTNEGELAWKLLKSQATGLKPDDERLKTIDGLRPRNLPLTRP